MSQENNTTDSLLSQFAASLKMPVASRYFDEDALIEIIAECLSQGDDYMLSEALALGLRLYPESEVIKLQRALAYLLENPEKCMRYLDDCVDFDTVATRFLRLVTEKDCLKFVEDVRTIIRDVDTLANPEIFILLRVADFNNNVDILYVFLAEELRKRAESETFMLHEFALLLFSSRNYYSAVAVLEKLTEIEPFDAEYWRMLTQSYINTDKYEKAAQALEYFAALAPDDINAQLLRARIVMENGDVRQAVEVMENVCDRVNDAELYNTLIALCYELGDNRKIRKVVKTGLAKYPGDTRIVGYYLLLNRTGARKVIKEYLSHQYQFTEEERKSRFTTILQLLVDNGRFKTAADLVAVMDKAQIYPEDIKLMPMALYLAEDYRKAIDIMQTQVDAREQPLSPCEVLQTLAIDFASMMRLGDLENLVPMLNRVTEDKLQEKGIYPETTIFGKLGALTVIRNIIERISEIFENYADDIDRIREEMAKDDPFYV